MDELNELRQRIALLEAEVRFLRQRYEESVTRSDGVPASENKGPQTPAIFLGGGGDRTIVPAVEVRSNRSVEDDRTSFNKPSEGRERRQRRPWTDKRLKNYRDSLKEPWASLARVLRGSVSETEVYQRLIPGLQREYRGLLSECVKLNIVAGLLAADEIGANDPCSYALQVARNANAGHEAADRLLQLARMRFEGESATSALIDEEKKRAAAGIVSGLFCSPTKGQT